MPPSRTFTTIYADPPWHYRDQCHAGKRGAIYKYGLMTDADIAAMPVAKLAAPDSVLFLWATWPKLPIALDVMAAWGFRYRTNAFVWVKVARGQRRARSLMDEETSTAAERRALVDGLALPALAWGMGHWSRANTEIVLLGTRGKPRAQSHAVHQVVLAPAGAHSAKPAEVRRRIELLAEGPRLELFARGRTPPGWWAWGNQAEAPRVLPPRALAP